MLHFKLAKESCKCDQSQVWVCDQESRERERRLAEELGTHVLEALNEDDLEMTRQDPAQMNITASFNDLEDQPAADAWQVGKSREIAPVFSS